MRRLPAPVVVGAAWLAGSIPFSQLAARVRAGVDLREVGSGTVSGTSLYEVAGFGPLAVAGLADVAKGAVGPLLAGRDRPGLAAVASAAGVAGHDWSPWLDGAGGRGVSVALGALTARAWPGTVVLAAGLAAGRLAHQTGLGTLVALAGAAIGATIVAKRLAGNRPATGGWATYAQRLLFDRDAPPPATPEPVPASRVSA